MTTTAEKKKTSWAVRLPMNLKLKDLDGCTLDSDEKILVIRGVSYQLMATDQSAAASTVVCALETKKKRNDNDDDDSSDSDEDEDSSNSSGKKKSKKAAATKKKKTTKKKKAKPIPLVATPTESYSLVETNLDASDAMLRTTTIDNSSAVPDTILRKAYRHVPQVTGLKRRWMPLGNMIGDWRPRSVGTVPLLSSSNRHFLDGHGHGRDDDAAAVVDGTAAAPVRALPHPVDDIQPEIKAEQPDDAPNVAVSGKKRSRLSSSSKKDKSAKKSKRKKNT